MSKQMLAIDTQFIVGPCGRDFAMANVNNQRLNTFKFHVQHINFNTSSEERLHNLQNRQVTYKTRTETMTRAPPE